MGVFVRTFHPGISACHVWEYASLFYTHMDIQYVDCNMEFSQLCSSLKSSGLWNEEPLAQWELVHAHCHKMTLCVCVFLCLFDAEREGL